jgi:hypothetical protein
MGGVVVLVFLSACEKEPKGHAHDLTTASPSLAVPVSHQTNRIPAAALERAQKEYQGAYDKYVKMLRESGPQTMETLHCLSDYQKKFRIYQNLVEEMQGQPPTNP